MVISASLDPTLRERRPARSRATSHWSLRRASGALLYEAASLLKDDDALRAASERLGEALDVVFTDPPYAAHKWGETAGAASEVSAINALRRIEHIGIQATNGAPQGIDLIFIAHAVNLLRPGGYLLICTTNITRTRRPADGAALGYVGARDRLRLWSKRLPHGHDREVGASLLSLLEMGDSAHDLRARGVPLIWLGLEFRHRHDEGALLVDAAPVVADTPACSVPERRVYGTPFRQFLGPRLRRTLPLDSREAFDTAFWAAFGGILVPDVNVLDPIVGSASVLHR